MGAPIRTGRAWCVARSLFESDRLFGLPPLPDDIPVPQRPIPGQVPYYREHARIFFGRGRAIRTLYNAVTEKSGSSILLFYGPIGAGKTSILLAGLAPRLEADHQVQYVRRDPARGLMSTLSRGSRRRPGY